MAILFKRAFHGLYHYHTCAHPMSLARERQIERCGRRAAESLLAGDVVLTNAPDGSLIGAMLAALDDEVREAVAIAGPDDGAEPTCALVLVERAALDGGLAVSDAALRCVEIARSQRVPCYALLPGGPDPQLPTTLDLPVSSELAILPPETMNAIITDRGLYRAEMLVRYLNDGDAPIEVIPLSR